MQTFVCNLRGTLTLLGLGISCNKADSTQSH
jgi:hypothetical protein